MSGVDHVKAEIRDRALWRDTARRRRTEAIEQAVKAQQIYDQAVATMRDAAGIIAEETEKIDELLERLQELIPRQRDGD